MTSTNNWKDIDATLLEQDTRQLAKWLQEYLSCLCDRVVETGEPVVITRPDGNHVALIAEAELSSLLETLHLLRSPANATRLMTALARSQSGTVAPETVDALCDRLKLRD